MALRTVNNADLVLRLPTARDLPVILMELDGSTVDKTYIYANGQILAQHTGDHTADRYFYLHDRLGSVRQIISWDDGTSTVDLENRYTYKPFGELFDQSGEDETEETIGHSFKFTGQYFDSEIDQYYLRARQYYPHIARFTSRDPVRGDSRQPLTLHRYLYCLNDPVNRVDPEGRSALGCRVHLISPILTGWALYTHGLNLATYAAWSENWKFFDLAQATFNFMYPGMALACLGPRTIPGAIVGVGFGLTFEELTNATGMVECRVQ